MSRRLRRATGTGAVLVALLAAGLAAGLPALADRKVRTDEPVGVVAHRVVGPALGYWTPERLRSAVPADLLGGLVGGLLPQAPPPVARPSAAGNAVPKVAAVAGTIPAVGKVFFSLPSGNYVCTGTLVQSANRDTVATAGHCVWGDRGWAANWVFIPGYHDGGGPYGQYQARMLYTTGGFQSREDLNVDAGFADLATGPGGRHAADVIPPQPIAFNQPRHQYLTTFGYPNRPPYDGSKLVSCSGTVHDDTVGHTSDQGMDHCPMTEGASGGPWFQRWDGSHGTVTSVTSVGYDNVPDVLWGPYFGDTIRQAYDTAQKA
jgi:V8-like Glu-specific endopeptidase